VSKYFYGIRNSDTDATVTDVNVSALYGTYIGPIYSMVAAAASTDLCIYIYI